MPAVQADSVIVLLEARIAKYNADIEAAAKKTEDVFNRIRAASAKPVTPTVGSGGSGLAALAEREAIRIEATRQREAAKTAGIVDRLEARKADKAIAETQRAVAAKEATEVASAARIAAIQQSLDDQQAARDELAQRRAAARVAAAASGGGNSSRADLLSGSSMSAIRPTATISSGIEDKTNYLLRDQIDLRAKLGAAIAAGETKAITALNDELALLRLIEQYKRAGLSETDAAVRAEQSLEAVIKARAGVEANAAAEQAANAAKGVAGTGRVANGYRNLGRQIADVGTSVAGGLNPFLIIAQQAPQVADALTDTGGKAAKVASFFAGPWGAALLAAGSVAGVLASKLLDSGESVQSLTKDLEKNAETSRLTDAAKKAFSATEEGAAESVRELTKALDDQNRALRSNAEQANITAKQNLENIQKELAKQQKDLADARAALQFSNTVGGGEAGNTIGQARVRDLEAQVAQSKRDAEDARIAVLRSRVPLAAQKAQSDADPVARVTKTYDDLIAAVQLNADKEARAGRDRSVQARKDIADLQRKKTLALEAAQAAQAETKKERNGPSAIGRTVNVAEATSIINGIGGRVTSGLRSNADQTRIYNDKLAGRHDGPVAIPGTSDHERGQAIDVAYGAGINVTSIKKAFADAGVRIRQILPEPQQRVFHVAFGDAGKSAESIARDLKHQHDTQVRDNAAFISENEQLKQQQIQAERAQTTDITALANYAREDIISAERKRIAQIDADQATGKYTKAQADENRLLTRNLASLQLFGVALDLRAKLEQQNLDKARAFSANQQDILAASIEGVSNRKLQQAVERQILEARYAQLRADQQAVIDSKDPKVTDAQRQAARDRLPVIDAQQAGATRDQNQNNRTSFERYRDNLKSTDSLADDIDGIKISILDDVTNSLAEATKNALGLSGALGDIVGQIIKIGIQRKLIGPLADALFGKQTTGADGSVSNSGGFLSSAFGSLTHFLSGGRASGGNVSAGKIYQINENGPEYFQPAQSGKIIPTGRAASASGGGNTTVVQQTFTIDNRGGITTPQLLQYVNNLSTQKAASAGRVAYNNSPQRSQKLSQLGS